jgi:hypothetical protein
VLPTPYADLNRVLEQFTSSVSSLLGDTLLGLYLQGSFAVGGFDEHSDVDFIAVLERDLTPGEVSELNAAHARIFEGPSEWARHLEGSYFPIDILRGTPGRAIWYLDHGSTTLERSDHCNTLVVRSVLERFGVPLFGPSAPHWVDPVCAAALRIEIRNTMIVWGEEILADPSRYANRFYQGYIVLNYSRMLHDLVRGEVGSKAAGAAWAKENLPRMWHGLIDRAWSCRLPSRSGERRAGAGGCCGVRLNAGVPAHGGGTCAEHES